jgi:hypothetical protein
VTQPLSTDLRKRVVSAVVNEEADRIGLRWRRAGWADTRALELHNIAFIPERPGSRT